MLQRSMDELPGCCVCIATCMTAVIDCQLMIGSLWGLIVLSRPGNCLKLAGWDINSSIQFGGARDMRRMPNDNFWTPTDRLSDLQN